MTASTAADRMHGFYGETRDRLVRRRAELTERQRRVERDLARSNEPLSADFADRAIQMQNDEALEAIGEAARTELQQVEVALGRIGAGTYGACAGCGDPIEAERLAAVPYATTCAQCAEGVRHPRYGAPQHVSLGLCRSGSHCDKSFDGRAG